MRAHQLWEGEIRVRNGSAFFLALAGHKKRWQITFSTTKNPFWQPHSFQNAGALLTIFKEAIGNFVEMPSTPVFFQKSNFEKRK
jgi:hypothetical protein